MIFTNIFFQGQITAGIVKAKNPGFFEVQTLKSAGNKEAILIPRNICSGIFKATF